VESRSAVVAVPDAAPTFAIYSVVDPEKETAMFKNVLVGVDGRPNGRDAIALASRLMDPDGKLTLAHVHGGELHPSHAISPGMVKEERERSKKMLEAERAAAEVDAELVSIVDSTPGRGLHLEAEARSADLLAVGSCGRGAIGRAMLGDDTRAALNGAPCAVAVASLGYAEHPTPIGKVGVAYNATPESEAALAVARELAAPTRATVHALEVVPLKTYAYTGLVPPAIGDSIDVMLQEANTRLKKLSGVEARAVYGLTGEELASFGDEVDILVVGSRSYGPVRRLVVGSTSHYLERHARCSLLVLPRSAAAAGTGGEDGERDAGAPAAGTTG
jgi:nucleotide-binding universal stress UspA family protein